MRSDLKKKLDSFTLETSKNYLIHNFLRNGRVRVNSNVIIMKYSASSYLSHSHVEKNLGINRVLGINSVLGTNRVKCDKSGCDKSGDFQP